MKRSHRHMLFSLLPGWLFAAAFLALPAAANVCSDGVAEPPFLSYGTGAKPNLLLMIDNSASMFDLAYVDEAEYCYDDSYNPAAAYAGYFGRETWYAYEGGRFVSKTDVEAAAACGTSTRKKSDAGGADNICLTLAGDAFQSLFAKGNFFNWVAASKLDIKKGILTGGKYEGGELVMESRGCLERRFVKQTPFDDIYGADKYYLTLAVRPPKAGEKSDLADLTTRVELFPATAGGYNHQACQEAVEMVEDGNLGQLGKKIEECMGYDKTAGQNSLESSSQTSFNHSLQDCWYFSKHGVWPPGAGSVTRIMNDCESVYLNISPIEITTDHSGYVCYGNHSLHNTDPTAPLYLRGYVGRCWDTGGVVTCEDVPCTDPPPHNKVRCVDGYWEECLGNLNNQWKCAGNPGIWVRVQDCTTDGSGVEGWNPANDPDRYACVDWALRDYCSMLNVPEVVDPSDQVGGTGDDTSEFWNIPAVLVDSGVQGQLGEPLAVLKARIDRPAAPSGLLQEFAVDLRIGAMVFNYDGAWYECKNKDDRYITYNCDEDANTSDGGRVIALIDNGPAHTTNLVSAVNSIVANTWTPMAETIFNAIGYYTQRADLRLNLADFTIDPATAPITSWCQDNNILLITDGASTADQHEVMVNFATGLGYDDLGSGTCDSLHGSTYLDDLAYYAKEEQNIRTHIVVAGTLRAVEGAGKCSPDTLMNAAAGSGGTTLYEASNPEELENVLREVMSDMRSRSSAGSAASVISSSRGGEGAIYQAIFWPEREIDGNKITWVGEVHALFVNEHGHLYEDTDGDRALNISQDKRVVIFFDEEMKRSRACYGGFDSNGACPGGIVEVEEVRYLWSANNWLAKISHSAAFPPYGQDDISTQRSPFISSSRQRYIFTWNDFNNDGIVDYEANLNTGTPKEILPFVADGWADFAVSIGRGSAIKDFNATSLAEVKDIIEWIRGIDEPGNQVPPVVYRSRQTEKDLNRDGTVEEITWRLGDVIHSTPMVVSRPAENYHFIYGDSEYGKFVQRYMNRRHMVYFGANDGMLHAVNGGFYNETAKKFCLTADCQGEGGDVPELGAEMWAYVPYNLLPHLKCLTLSNYSHKYYVDQRPRMFDVQIFDEEAACTDHSRTHPECIHPHGWGTILVGGMRFGGNEVKASDLNANLADKRVFTSAYFILDITNPEAPPTLLGEFTYKSGELQPLAKLGYSTSIPTMVIMKDDDGNNSWYLILGNGPTSVRGESNMNAKLAVLPLEWLVGAGRKAFRIRDTLPSAATNQGGVFTLGASGNGFVSDLITVDFDISGYHSDAVYFGTVEGSFGNWGGKMYRLVTREIGVAGQVSTTPEEWHDLWPKSDGNYAPLFDARQPIVASPAAGFDGHNYWIYFGTGRFYDTDDKDDNQLQTYYGIKEPVSIACDGQLNWATVGKNQTNAAVPGQRGLLKVDQIVVKADGSRIVECRELDELGNKDPDCEDFLANNLPNDTLGELTEYIAGKGCVGGSPTGIDGWYKDFLLERERNLGQAALMGGLLTFTTYQPYSDPCLAEGLSNLYGVYYQTGTAWHRSIFGTQHGVVAGMVADRVALGRGLATTPNIHVGSGHGARAFVQTSTGEIQEIEQTELPLSNFRTGRTSWREVQ